MEQRLQRMLEQNPLMAEHPLVTVHPETGERVLYTSQEFTRNIVGLEPRESDALLEFLVAHATRPEFTFRHRWEPGQPAILSPKSSSNRAA